MPLLWVFVISTFRNSVFLTSASIYLPALNLSSAHLCCLCFLFPMSLLLTWSHIAAAMGVRPLFHSTPSSVGWCFEPTAAPSFWKRRAQNETFCQGKTQEEQGYCKTRQEVPKAVLILYKGSFMSGKTSELQGCVLAGQINIHAAESTRLLSSFVLDMGWGTLLLTLIINETIQSLSNSAAAS